MITKDEKQMFKRYRDKLGFQKFPRYIKWMHKKFPGKDLHHIAGSTFGRKFTDALLIPLDHKFHLCYVEKEKAKYFCFYLRTAYSHFLEWVKDELNTDAMFLLDEELTPEKVSKYIDLVYNEEYRKILEEILV